MLLVQHTRNFRGEEEEARWRASASGKSHLRHVKLRAIGPPRISFLQCSFGQDTRDCENSNLVDGVDGDSRHLNLAACGQPADGRGIVDHRKKRRHMGADGRGRPDCKL